VSNDSSIDQSAPASACAAARASRGRRIAGEKIDIIPWSADPATFVVNALAPAEVAKVVLDEENNRMECRGAG